MLVKMPPGTVGNRIREKCQDRDWNISDLSRKAGISIPTARALWYGHAKGAEWKTMGKVAQALDADIGDIFQLISDNNNEPKEKKR